LRVSTAGSLVHPAVVAFGYVTRTIKTTSRTTSRTAMMPPRYI
jgi:hypothetical protein